MLTKTTRSAIRALTYLGLYGASEPISPRHLAEHLGESPTYLAKVMRHLVRAGILQAHRGVAGGVVLNRSAEQITLRHIVEACQGTILPDFCTETGNLTNVCAFHRAGAELHEAITGVLSRWTLAQFLTKPHPDELEVEDVHCWLEPNCPKRPRRPARAAMHAPEPPPATDRL